MPGDSYWERISKDYWQRVEDRQKQREWDTFEQQKELDRQLREQVRELRDMQVAEEAEKCKHCNRGPDEHVNKKCLFDASSYEPKGWM